MRHRLWMVESDLGGWEPKGVLSRDGLPPALAAAQVSLPPWLPPQDWIENWREGKVVLALGLGPRTEDVRLRLLLAAPLRARLALARLFLRPTQASPALRSLRRDLLEWCAKSPAERRFQTPFSVQGWRAVLSVAPLEEAKALRRAALAAPGFGFPLRFEMGATD